MPTYFLTTVGVLVLMTFPLMSAVPDFERALLREPLLRGLRAVTVLVGAWTTIAVTCAVSDVEVASGIQRLIPLLVVLESLAIAAVVVLGDVAWLVPFLSGFLALVFTATSDSAGSRLLPYLHPPALGGLVLAVVAVYVWRGPRLPA